MTVWRLCDFKKELDEVELFFRAERIELAYSILCHVKILVPTFKTRSTYIPLKVSGLLSQTLIFVIIFFFCHGTLTDAVSVMKFITVSVQFC